MRVLVAYATRAGSTKGVAEAIGAALEARGHRADVAEVRETGSLAGYDAVVVGSGIRVRRWLREAADFIRAHRDELADMPVAYFAVCLTLLHRSPLARAEAERYGAYPRKRFPDIESVAETVFAGVLDLGKLDAAERALVMPFGVDEGDYRDWDAIRSWATTVAEAFERVPVRA